MGDREGEIRIVRLTAEEVVSEAIKLALTQMLSEAAAGKNSENNLSALKKIQRTDVDSDIGKDFIVEVDLSTTSIGQKSQHNTTQIEKLSKKSGQERKYQSHLHDDNRKRYPSIPEDRVQEITRL